MGSKLSYEIMDDAAQAFLKMKIMDNIHKYYYLIVFTAYMREAADAARNLVPDDKKAELTLTGGKCAIPAYQLKLSRKFAAFMEENKKLIDLCETGKSIHDIYQTAHVMFSDMPQGDHKKRAKYRFAS